MVEYAVSVVGFSESVRYVVPELVADTESVQRARLPAGAASKRWHVCACACFHSSLSLSRTNKTCLTLELSATCGVSCSCQRGGRSQAA